MNKKIKLSLNKQTVVQLDNVMLKEVQGGKEQQFLSIFHCTRTEKCFNDTIAVTGRCNTTTGPVNEIDTSIEP